MVKLGDGGFRMAESCPIPRQSDSVRLRDAKICLFNKHPQGILSLTYWIGKCLVANFTSAPASSSVPY